MTTIVSVAVDDERQRMAIEVDDDSLGAEWFTLQRSFGPFTEAVRGDDVDHYTRFPAVGGSRTLFDVEVPRGTPVSYRATAANTSSSSTSDPSDPVTLDAAGDCAWWVHPLSEPRLATTFEGETQANQIRAVAHGKFAAIGRRDPIVLFGTRGTPSGTLTARSEDYDGAQALAELLGRPEVLVVRTSPIVGWAPYGRRYLAVDTIALARLGSGPVAPVGRESEWSVDLPWVEVASPPVPVLTFGATYADVLAHFATYQAVLDAFPTYDDLLAWVP